MQNKVFNNKQVANAIANVVEHVNKKLQSLLPLHTHKFPRGCHIRPPIVKHPTKKVVDQFWHNLWNFYEYPQNLDN